MFDVYANSESLDLSKIESGYVVAKDGIYLKKKIGLMNSLVKVKEIPFLKEIQQTCDIDIPKIPGAFIARVTSFFKKIYEIHRSEAVIMIFYKPETKSFKMFIPVQEVDGSDLSYKKDEFIDGYVRVGSIHSHSGFGAFHSSTDSKDEGGWDGIHITIGHLGNNIQSFACSIMANEYRRVVDPLNYINGIESVSELEESKLNTVEDFSELMYGNEYMTWDTGSYGYVESHMFPYLPDRMRNHQPFFSNKAKSYKSNDKFYKVNNLFDFKDEKALAKVTKKPPIVLVSHDFEPQTSFYKGNIYKNSKSIYEFTNKKGEITNGTTFHGSFPMCQGCPHKKSEDGVKETPKKNEIAQEDFTNELLALIKEQELDQISEQSNNDPEFIEFVGRDIDKYTNDWDYDPNDNESFSDHRGNAKLLSRYEHFIDEEYGL